MKKFRGIVLSLKEPRDKEVLWLKNNNKLYRFNNGEWLIISCDLTHDGSNDSILEEAIEDLLSYGIKFNTSTGQCHTVGNRDLVNTLPIQSKIRNCIFDASTNTVVKWLDGSDWHNQPTSNYVTLTYNSFIPDGAIEEAYAWLVSAINGNEVTVGLDSYPYLNKGHYWDEKDEYYTVTNYDPIYNVVQLEGYERDASIGDTLELSITEDLCDGSIGEVMTYIPGYYRKVIVNYEDGKYVGTTIKISETKISESWEYVKPIYISSYRACVLLAPACSSYPYLSLFNTPGSYGYGAFSVSNKNLTTSNTSSESEYPTTSIDLSIIREEARRAGKEVMSYAQYRDLYWLIAIEMNSLNISDALGTSTTRVEGSTPPIVPNGVSDYLCNESGDDYWQDVSLARYRGIELPYGDTLTGLDGAVWVGGSRHVDKVYYTENPSLYANIKDNLNNPEVKSIEFSSPIVTGLVNDIVGLDILGTGNTGFELLGNNNCNFAVITSGNIAMGVSSTSTFANMLGCMFSNNLSFPHIAYRLVKVVD